MCTTAFLLKFEQFFLFLFRVDENNSNSEQGLEVNAQLAHPKKETHVKTFFLLGV